MSDLVHRPRIDGHATITDVCLRADTIKFVFNKELCRHGACYICKIGCRRGQHELDWVKQAHVNVSKFVGPGADAGFSDVAQKHVDLRHALERLRESASYSVLDQTLPQPNTQITGE